MGSKECRERERGFERITMKTAEFVCVCVCVYACARVCVRARVCVHAWVRVCVRARE